MAIHSAISRTPSNQNIMQARKHQFMMPNLPDVNFFCQSVLFPAVSTSAAEQDTPFSKVYLGGDKLIYEPLYITFIVDEDLEAWEIAYDWLRSFTFPHEHAEYRYSKFKESNYHDGILTLNTNSNISNIRLNFTNCHPISLSPLQLDHSVSADTILVANLTIRYDTFSIERIKI